MSTPEEGLCRLTWGDLKFTKPGDVVLAQGMLERFYRGWREERLKEAYSPPGATFRLHHVNTHTGATSVNRSAGKVNSIREAEEYVQRMNNETSPDLFYFLSQEDRERIQSRVDLLPVPVNFPYHRLNTDSGLTEERESQGKAHEVRSVEEAMKMAKGWTSSPRLIYYLTPEDKHELRKLLGEF